MASGSLDLVPDSLDAKYQLVHALKKPEDDLARVKFGWAVKKDRRRIELVVEEEVGAYWWVVVTEGSKRTMWSLWWRYIQHTFSTEETRCWKYAACYYVIPIPFPYLLATFELVSNFCSLRVRSVNYEWHTFITIAFNVLYSTTILGSPVANNFLGISLNSHRS